MSAYTVRYMMKHPGRVMGALASDPLSLWDTVHDRLVQNREYKRGPYAPAADPLWEEKLTTWLSMPRHGAAGDFDMLWPDVVREMESKGVATGPLSFNGYNDGDRGFVRAIWLIVRGLKPRNVVETGVAHGFTSRFILEAMERNHAGRLWSIDRMPLDPAKRAEVGAAVGDRFSHRWRLIEGTSRRRLPALLSSTGDIELFIHDSMHTERNVSFELRRAWKSLQPGGAVVVDDIDSNWGFESFVKNHDGLTAMVCEAEPIRPDTRRFNGKGLFGIILKDRAAG